jgi:tetratricopeptide (TPR) repeat protein
VKRIWFLFALSVLFVSLIYGQEDVTTIMMEADSHYSKRQAAGEVEESIVGYKKVLELDPANFDAAWKLSKAYWYVGNHAGSKPEKKKYFEEGVEAAQRAISIKSNDCRGHFWLGVNYGMVADTAGMFEALGMVDKIKSAVEQAIKINKNCECGGPQRVLGKLYARAPFFKGGSKTKAIRSLEQSLAACPNDTQSRIFLAEIYIDQNKKGLAIQQLKRVLQQKPDSDWIPETNENKALAQKMLNGLENSRVR